MLTRLIALIGITALTSGLFLAVPSLAGAASHPAGASRLGQPAGTLVVQGRVVGADGHTVGGVRVVLYAWPVASVMSKLRPGQRVPVRAVGSALTAATGLYGIRVISLAGLRSSAGHDGTVNLEVRSATSAGFAAFSFPRRLVSTPHGTALAVAASGSGGTTKLAPQMANLHLMHPVMRPAVGHQRRACGITFFIKSYGPKNVVVGSTYSVVPGVTMDFKYGNGQSSSLGVGISASGAFGSFSASGTSDISSTVEEDYPTFRNVASHRYMTEFVYGLFGITCFPDEARATSYAAGATTSGTSAPEATFCVLQQAGSTFIKNNTSAFTFSAGVSIAGAIGVDLSAQTGYDSNASLSYMFSTSRQLCGANDFPGGASKRIVAGLN